MSRRPGDRNGRHPDLRARRDIRRLDFLSQLYQGEFDQQGQRIERLESAGRCVLCGASLPTNFAAVCTTCTAEWGGS